tara:strand:+ start:27042 stop:27332 length:291 start_codon:yes stop_codon:yes gene_type:complete
MKLKDGQEIPHKVLTPRNRNMEAESRHAIVYGITFLDECLNPDCKNKGPLDALILGPLNLWPNIAIICGAEGCGIHWALIGEPPKETMWLHVDTED